MTVNLTALASARAKMTPSEFFVDGDGMCAGPEQGTGEIYPVGGVDIEGDDLAGIVATHNAADVLIEVAQSALSTLGVLQSMAAENVTFNSGSSRYVVQMIPAMEVRAVALALAEALAKVTL